MRVELAKKIILVKLHPAAILSLSFLVLENQGGGYNQGSQ
jgi:hypothetical protein